MKKVSISVLAMLMLLSVLAFPVLAEDINILVDGKQIISDVSPQVINGRVLVPIKFVGEALGATVEWVSGKDMVTVNKGSIAIALFLDSPNANINGQTVALDVPAVALDNRTMVPLRFVSENLGCTVNWDPSTSSIAIISDGSSVAPPTDAVVPVTPPGTEAPVDTSTDSTPETPAVTEPPASGTSSGDSGSTSSNNGGSSFTASAGEYNATLDYINLTVSDASKISSVSSPNGAGWYKVTDTAIRVTNLDVKPKRIILKLSGSPSSYTVKVP